MKLYYMAGACSLAAHIVLEWIGKPYETHALSREALKEPAFLKINPLGAVPALTEGDWALTQNAAILGQLDTHLQGRSFLAGARPSIADAYLYVVLRWAHGKQIDLSGQDNLAAFFERMQADPAVQAALKAEGLS